MGVIVAGDSSPQTALEPGTCIQIMTGTPIPPGTDSVVPIERVRAVQDIIFFDAQPQRNANIRFVGEDFKKGEPLFKTGKRLETWHILPLATLGLAQMSVFKKPRMAFLATGRELVDDLSAGLGSGQIYNSNRPYAVAVLARMGMECVKALTIHDDPDHFSKIIKEFSGLDFIISSGAVSSGAFDFVRGVLEKAGAEILYHKIQLKPGKPNLLARLPSGTLYFGLPGNPVACAVGLRFFVESALRAMMGQEKEKPIHARAMNKFSKKADLHTILKGRLESWEDGSLSVDILDGQDSFRVSPFLEMDCWIHVPKGIEGVKAGGVMEVYLLDPLA